MLHQNNPDFSRLLTYYQQEMAYLLQSGQLFARAYPRVAQGLDISHKGSSDPHVQRLLESFAFLAARLQLNLEDEYTLFSTAMLDVLYPQFTSPFPSCVMTQTSLLPDMSKQLAGTFIPARTILTATSDDGESCLFQTTMGSHVWPLEVADVSYGRVSNYTVNQPDLLRSPWLLKVDVHSKMGALKHMPPLSYLQFHLGGDMLTALTLFRWLNTYDPHDPIPIFIQKNKGDPLALLKRNPLRPVGFNEEETLVPAPLQLAPAYRLLLEYYMFPQKFLYIEVPHLDGLLQDHEGENFSLFFALGRNAEPEKWPLVPQNMRLGCVPAVNLFYKTAEPIRFDHRKTDYRLIPDRRREQNMEVHSVLNVSSAFDMATPAKIYVPYFSYTHQDKRADRSCFWMQRRVKARNRKISGTDLYLSFVDEKLNQASPAESTIYAHTLCTNRRFAEKVPVYARLDLRGEFAGVHVHTMDRPTRSIPPPIDGSTQWRLISHLSMDHLGVCTQTGSVEPLKELLNLYNLTKSSLSAASEAIQHIKLRQTMGHLGTEAWRGFVPLLSVSLIVDDVRANTQGFFLLSMILNELFKRSAGFNTLVETSMIGSSNKRLMKKWTPEQATGPLL